MKLLALELTRYRSLTNSTPDVDDAKELRALIDREEDAIDVRATTKIEDANRLIWIETPRRYACAAAG